MMFFLSLYLSEGTDRQGRRRVAVLLVKCITVHQEMSCEKKFKSGKGIKK